MRVMLRQPGRSRLAVKSGTTTAVWLKEEVAVQMVSFSATFSVLLANQCPGYICGMSDCTASAGVSSVMTSCPASYYLCPASFNYGCCLTGYGCATNACYVTTPSTTTYTRAVTTTTAGGQTVTTTRTATTVQTPTPPTALPTSSDSNAVAKFIPTSVEKVAATASPSSNVVGGGGGLTTAQLGGIIGGAIALLVFVGVAAFIVLRRLNRVSKAVGTAKASPSDDQSRSTRLEHPNMAQYGRPSPSEMDGLAYDPLMMSTPGDSSTGTPQTIGVHGRNRSDSDHSQPAVTPYGCASGTPYDGARHLSMDSNPTGAGYFDIPARTHNMPGRRSMRTSTDSHGNVQQHGTRPDQQQHGRQWSNASELSNTSSDAAYGVGSQLIPAELDISGGFIPELPSAEETSLADGGRRRSGSSTTAASPPPSLTGHRRHSSGSTLAAGLPSPAAMTGLQPLDSVSEGTEAMHGYHGPRYGQAGQTAAGLDISHDITSPVAVRFRPRSDSS